MEADSGALIFILLIAGVICGFIGAAIGETKRRTAQGFWLGFLLGPIGVIVIALLDKRDQVQPEKMTQHAVRPQRKCPFCAELVLQEAVICRFCQRDLPPGPIPDRDPIFRTAAR